jgi:hypothetical protein
MCSRLQVWGWETPTLLCSLERANLNHWTQIDPVYERLCLDKAQNPVILSSIHHHQNPLELKLSASIRCGLSRDQ